jgi:hypothetical protein
MQSKDPIHFGVTAPSQGIPANAARGEFREAFHLG